MKNSITVNKCAHEYNEPVPIVTGYHAAYDHQAISDALYVRLQVPHNVR